MPKDVQEDLFPEELKEEQENAKRRPSSKVYARGEVTEERNGVDIGNDELH